DTLPFIFEQDSLEIALLSAVRGEKPYIDDLRLNVIQSWADAREGRFDEALEAARRSRDEMLLGCLALLAGEPPSERCIPPLMIPPGAWNEYMTGDMSGGDESIVEASALFVCGMRDRSMNSVMAVLNGAEELSPWALSVSGGLAALAGMDSLAVMLGDSALSLSRNPYTLLMRGSIAGTTGSPYRAVEFFSECLDISKAFNEARFQRAQYLWIIGSVDEAMEDYRLLRQLNYLMPAFESMFEWGEYFTES
ncbi:MAG: hypothetical protein KAT09_03790, partial [Candidatus Aegiribacteria sp.]|nr:hypothetical protein [Candidatus Aegiribacteria sp.]